MRFVKTRLVVAAWAVLALGALGLGYLVHLVRSVDTPEFRQSVLDHASSAAGTKVQARTVDISLLRGVTLRGVRVANPPPFPGDLLTADAFILRYSPWTLLVGRLELSRLSLEKPALTLAMDARGVFNYERLGSASPAPVAQGSRGLPVALVLSKLSVDKARIVVRDPRAPFVKIEGADLDSSLEVAGTSIDGKGTVRLALVNLADSLFVRGVSAPLQAANGTLVLAPLKGTVAKGEVRGDVRVRLQDSFHFSANLTVEGAQLEKLLEEAKAGQSASGALGAKASVEGSGGVATLKGQGHVQVAGCKVAHVPLMTLLSTAFRVPELAHPEFKECRADFTLGDGRLVTPSVSLKGPAMEITGHGVMRLETLALDYDMTLALSKALLDRIPVHELRAGFKERADGFGVMDFKVTGTTAAPQTDLSARLGKAAASEAAEGGLNKLLHKGKIF
jgi:uncharacterized protein involved in outer membrane biogenesis